MSSTTIAIDDNVKRQILMFKHRFEKKHQKTFSYNETLTMVFDTYDKRNKKRV